ncbi:MAG: ISNCY family transposase [Tannerellaceae bacterium]|nr:ISNCY family transposase [Tannerellaceae bacterium]
MKLTMDEQKKYEIIKALAECHGGNKQRAALLLGCTYRHINRMLAGYRNQGKEYFSHGNKGRKPAITIPDETKKHITDLYRAKYFGANFTHFTELLKSVEGIEISVSSVSKILEAEYILSPKVTKAKRKRIKRELEEKKKVVSKKKEADTIQANIVAVEDAHSRRPRCAYFGELLQMDASSYVWFGNEKTTLHVAIDDATGTVTGAWFDKEETLNGYYNVFYQTLTNYGIPYKFLTDRRTVFTYKKKDSPSIDKDTCTQFAYACKQLGVAMEYSSIPQAKGRVERLNQTLQSRLPIEMRLAGVTTIAEANEFLIQYLKKFNQSFSLPLNNIKSVFENQPSSEKINLILAVLMERTVDNGHCIQFNNRYYRMLDSNGLQIHYRKGTKVMVIQAFDNNLYCSVNDENVYALDEIPKHEPLSKEIDIGYEEPKPKKRYIPPMNHPWRKSSFNKFANSQPHHHGIPSKNETYSYM